MFVIIIVTIKIWCNSSDANRDLIRIPKFEADSNSDSDNDISNDTQTQSNSNNEEECVNVVTKKAILIVLIILMIMIKNMLYMMDFCVYIYFHYLFWINIELMTCSTNDNHINKYSNFITSNANKCI